MVKYEIDEEFLDTLLKGLDQTPTFQQNMNAGEGTPGPEEIAYVKSLNDLLKVAYSQVLQIPSNLSIEAKTKKVDDVIDEYVSAAQKSANKHVTDTYVKYQGKANQIAESKGLRTSNDRTLLNDFLLPYQLNAIRKNGVELREKLVDLIYRLSYFGVAYNAKK